VRRQEGFLFNEKTKRYICRRTRKKNEVWGNDEVIWTKRTTKRKEK